MTHTLFIGAAVADRIITIDHAVQLAASNIVHSSLRPGGVSANTARALTTAGGRATLLTTLGKDSLGTWLHEEMTAHGIATHALQTMSDLPTVSYSAVHGPDGELVIGLAEMDIFEQIAPAGQAEIEKHIDNAQHIFLDASLAADTLRHIATYKTNQFLSAAAVSPAKSARLKGAATAIDFLFCNRREAAALTGIDSEAPCPSYVAPLQALGFRTGIITDGIAPLTLFSPSHHELIAVPQLKVHTVVNGAGDALAGGILFGLTQGQDPKSAISGPGFAAVSRHISA